MPPSSPKTPVRKTLSVWLATGLGFGFSPIMPGTVGCLWGIPLSIGIAHLPSIVGLPIVVGQIVLIVLLCAIGVPLCTAAGRQFGKKDPGAIVWDEIAALPIVFFLVSPEQMMQPLTLLVGFLLFRLFDITKPPPIKRFEELPDGLGVMADDWVAALMALPFMHLFLWAVASFT